MSKHARQLLWRHLAWLLAWASSVSVVMLVAGMPSGQKPVVNVQAGQNVRVSDVVAPHVEPYIAAHPANPRNLLVVASHVVARQEGFLETFSTADGGRTWSVSRPPPLPEPIARKETVGLPVNPWVTYAPDGTAYCSTIVSLVRGRISGGLPILIYRSHDQGASWEKPSLIRPYFDRPAMLATGSGKDKRLFVTAMGISSPSDPTTVAVLRSVDDGMNFQLTLLTPDNLGHNALNPVVTPGALLIVPYIDFPSTGLSREQYERRRHLMHSSRIYIVASRDEGQTFGPPRFVADVPRSATGFPQVAVDLSRGRYRGRLYLAWNGEPEASQNVTVARSDNDGDTWLTTVIKDPSAGPAYFSGLAVTKDGTVGVAWVQYQTGESRKKCWHTYFAASLDGGETFSPPLRISSAVSCLDPIANKNALPERERGAEYMGLAAAADGAFHAAWADGRDGAFQIYTVRITVRAD